MQRRKNWFVTSLLVCLLAGSAFAQEYVMFSYQGRVRVQGQAFTGTGQFKFAILNTAGSATLWTNDGTAMTGGQPTASCSAQVADGVFSVMVGDPLLGMAPINSSIFSSRTPLKLRTWFSNGSLGFEQLHPDDNLVNLTLVTISTGSGDFVIYVDPATGSDANNGLTTQTAKRTIQGAVNIVPGRLNCNVVIDIAPAVYREEVRLFGISAVPGKTLTVLGDESWTSASASMPTVRICGKDSDAPGAPYLREHAIWARSCSGVVFRGIHADSGSATGIALESGSYDVRNCALTGCGVHGILAHANSQVQITECVATNDGTAGYYIATNSNARFQNCSSTSSDFGVFLNGGAVANFYGSGNFSNNRANGMQVIHFSNAVFDNDYSGSISNNGGYAIQVVYYGYTSNHTRNTMTGNVSGQVFALYGGQTY
jgi:hypothetical protein